MGCQKRKKERGKETHIHTQNTNTQGHEMLLTTKHMSAKAHLSLWVRPPGPDRTGSEQRPRHQQIWRFRRLDSSSFIVVLCLPCHLINFLQERREKLFCFFECWTRDQSNDVLIWIREWSLVYYYYWVFIISIIIMYNFFIFLYFNTFGFFGGGGAGDFEWKGH